MRIIIVIIWGMLLMTSCNNKLLIEIVQYVRLT